MIKHLSKALYIITFTFLFSCNTEVKEEKKVEIDSTSIKESIRNKRILQIADEVNADFILDSLRFNYTIDAQKMLKKKVLMDMVTIDDIYEDNSGYHIVCNEGDYSINIICSAEQINSLKSPDAYLYSLTMEPSYVKKINLQLVANVDNDGDEETDDEANFAMEDFNGSYPFIINGRLLEIRSISKKEFRSLWGIQDDY